MEFPKIIYVDDEQSALDMFSAILKGLHAEIVLLSEPETALDIIFKEKFAVIFLDLYMPVLDGISLAKEIRNKPGVNQNTPLIFLSAHYYNDIRVEEGYQLGAVDFLPKPVSAPMLRSKARTFISLEQKNNQLKEVNNSLSQTIEDLSSTQKKLFDRENQLILAQKLAKMGTWVWDLQTNKFEWSKSLYDIHDIEIPESYEPDKFNYLAEYVYEEDKELIENFYIDADKPNRDAFTFEYRIVTKQNTLKYLRAIGINNFEKHNHPIKKIGTVLDITEQKKVENELQKKQQYLSMAISAANLIVYEFDLESKYFKFSDEIKEMFGQSANKEVHYSEVKNHVSEHEWNKIKRCFDKVIEGKQKYCEFEYEYRFNGELLQFMNRGVLVDDQYLMTKKFVGAFIDITNLRRTEKQLADLNRDLLNRINLEVEKSKKQQQLIFQKSKLESLGELAAGIGHEINNPLSIISLSVENAMERLTHSDSSKEYLVNKLKRISESTYKISNILKQIRIFSRDQKEDDLIHVSMENILENVMSLIDAQFNNHNIRIHSNLNASTHIRGNTIKLEQILFNLFSNSKYAIIQKQKRENNFVGKIEISTFEWSSRLFFRFQDNGVGISDDIIEKIFDPFFTTKEKENGTGLGLSIVYGITKELNGNIEVSSKEGEYTIFEFDFPIVESN